MLSYNPKNWYWVVNGSTTQVYSSAVGDYVPVANPAYVAWLAQDNRPTPIASEAELGDVLAPHALRPTPAAILDAYKDSQAGKLTIEIASKLFFNHENRLRTLEGQSTYTPNQFKTAIKALM